MTERATRVPVSEAVRCPCGGVMFNTPFTHISICSESCGAKPGLELTVRQNVAGLRLLKLLSKPQATRISTVRAAKATGWYSSSLYRVSDKDQIFRRLPAKQQADGRIVCYCVSMDRLISLAPDEKITAELSNIEPEKAEKLRDVTLLEQRPVQAFPAVADCPS